MQSDKPYSHLSELRASLITYTHKDDARLGMLKESSDNEYFEVGEDRNLFLRVSLPVSFA